ncbi:MAG: hypothetical protein IJ874_07230 [Ruminococcus sp.]|nr:hypothetical protein [Ruminococcus sp.]
MKKKYFAATVIRAGLAAAVAAAALSAAACSSGERSVYSGTGGVPQAEESTEPTTIPIPDRPRHEYSGNAIVGRWTDYASYLTFSAEGTVSAEVDLTGELYFDTDGSVMADGVEVPPENVSYDGETLTIRALKGEATGVSDIMILKRTGEADPDSIDGEYELVSGTLVQSLRSQYSGAKELRLVIDWGECWLEVSDFCTYTQDSDMLVFSGAGKSLLGLDDTLAGAVLFELDGDRLTLYFNNGSAEIYDRADDEAAAAEDTDTEPDDDTGTDTVNDTDTEPEEAAGEGSETE